MFLLNEISKLPPSAYIIMLLIFAASVAFLGTLCGVGGGVLHIPVMIWVLTIPIEEVKFISTILVCASSLVNIVIGAIKKENNYWIILVGIIIATPSVYLGSFLNSKIVKLQNVTEWIIVALLTYVSIQLILNRYILRKKEVVQNSIKKRSWFHIKLNNSEKLVNIFLLAIIVFFASMVTALTGMGGGVILMPFFLIIIKLNFKESAPLSHSIIFITSILTIIFESTLGGQNFFSDSSVMTSVTLPMFFGAIAGTICSAIVKKYIKKDEIILWILIILIWISIIKMFIDLIS